jgi:hypothetical protein
MTAAGPPPDHSLSAWHSRFPDRRLWAARLRLWRVELPVRLPSLLGEWIRKASADGASVATVARRLGLPAGIIRAADGPTRQEFAFLDLPGGPHPVSVPPVTFRPWPDPITSVPPVILRPSGVDVVPMTADWRTIPLVRAETVDVIAVDCDGRIDVYTADDPHGPALWQLPADTWPGPRPVDVGRRGRPGDPEG